jgi:hypothetical protein
MGETAVIHWSEELFTNEKGTISKHNIRSTGTVPVRTAFQKQEAFAEHANRYTSNSYSTKLYRRNFLPYRTKINLSETITVYFLLNFLFGFNEND